MMFGTLLLYLTTTKNLLRTESTVSITVESSQTIVYGTFIPLTGAVPAETSEFTSQQQTSTTGIILVIHI